MKTLAQYILTLSLLMLSCRGVPAQPGPPFNNDRNYIYILVDSNCTIYDITYPTLATESFYGVVCGLLRTPYNDLLKTRSHKTSTAKAETNIIYSIANGGCKTTIAIRHVFDMGYPYCLDLRGINWCAYNGKAFALNGHPIQPRYRANYWLENPRAEIIIVDPDNNNLHRLARSVYCELNLTSRLYEKLGLTQDRAYNFVHDTLLIYCPAPIGDRLFKETSGFSDPDSQPKFPGDLTSFIKEHLVYPAELLAKDVSGRVVVTFKVNIEGSLSDIKVLKGPGIDEGPIDRSMEAAALSLIRKMPKWIPATLNGRTVESQYVLPVTFLND